MSETISSERQVRVTEEMIEAAQDVLSKYVEDRSAIARALEAALSASPAAQTGERSDPKLTFDLSRSFDIIASSHYRAGRQLYNVIDWRGEHRGQVALTPEERDALPPLAPSAPQPTEPVAVKALQWTQKAPPGHDHEPFVYWAAGLGGHYRAERDGVLWMAHDAFVWERHGSQKEAQAAAQADYNARIRSALISPAPQGREEVIEECAKVAEGPIYKEHYRGREGHNWSAERHPNNPYGNGRMDAAAAIRSLSSPSSDKTGDA